MDIISAISNELGITVKQTESAVKLLDEGNTVPFIARYRKEVTDCLDDNQLRDLCDRLNYLRNLDKRREEIRSSIDEQGALTEELTDKILKAETLAALEDLYLPFKKKRRTRASMAKEKGLEPLALKIFEQIGSKSALALAEEFVNPELGVETAEDAVNGASVLIAVLISDYASV
ncbi:MAG: Tex-like N-terminal domain-containing protein, partial [Oscillospiraceae bacterium]